MKTTAHCFLLKISRLSTLTTTPKSSLRIELSRPKYDGKYLHQIVKEKVEYILTKIVVPTFDIKRLQPTICSSYEVKKNPSQDALLSDICIATSVAPTYLPTHYFETKDNSGRSREFNLIDGGVAANNPRLTKSPRRYTVGIVTSPPYSQLDMDSFFWFYH